MTGEEGPPPPGGELPENILQVEKEPQFPRGRAFPVQSPLFWVDQKERYLRQLLIRDIEERTGRHLIVYFTDCGTNAQIDHYDDQYLLELINDLERGPLDLLLETNGGMTDATEKVVSVLSACGANLRVVVPKRAKSNGTLIALAASEIVMGPASELGPVDPNIPIGPGVWAPAQFLVQDPAKVNPIVFQAAQHAIKQTQKLATTVLKNGMLKEKSEAQIEAIVNQLSTRDVYHSHGSVIDATEAQAMDLKVRPLDRNDELWKWFWLLRCMYAEDARRRGVTKIFEGRRISHSLILNPNPTDPPRA